MVSGYSVSLIKIHKIFNIKLPNLNKGGLQYFRCCVVLGHFEIFCMSHLLTSGVALAGQRLLGRFNNVPGFLNFLWIMALTAVTKCFGTDEDRLEGVFVGCWEQLGCCSFFSLK